MNFLFFKNWSKTFIFFIRTKLGVDGDALLSSGVAICRNRDHDGDDDPKKLINF